VKDRKNDVDRKQVTSHCQSLAGPDLNRMSIVDPGSGLLDQDADHFMAGGFEAFGHGLA
jgi:hypothetical protein